MLVKLMLLAPVVIALAAVILTAFFSSVHRRREIAFAMSPTTSPLVATR